MAKKAGNKMRCWSTWALALLGIQPALSETIQFERVVGPGADLIIQAPAVYAEAGFEFLGPAEFRILSASYFGVSISNGTDMGFVQSPPGFNLSATGGDPFSLQCLDAGQAFGSAAGTLTVTGTLAAGGTLTETFSTATGAFTTFDFPSTWINLSSVDFLSTSNFMSVDNICVTPGNTNTIGFEGVVPPDGSTVIEQPMAYSEQGFDFVGSTDFRILSDTFPNFGISNGTDNGFVQNPPAFSIAANSGVPFAIQCIDTGQSFGVAPGIITVTGNLAAGGTLSESIGTETNTFNSFDFPPTWVDLSSVGFSSSGNFLALDNVCLQPRLRTGLLADVVTAMVPTEFSGADFDSGNTAVVQGDVEFSDRFNGNLHGIDVDIDSNRLTFTYFNDEPSGTFNLGLLGLELTDLDFLGSEGEPLEISAVLLEESNFPAGTFDAIAIGATSIIFDLSSPNLVIPGDTEWVATFRILAFPAGTLFMDGFEDLD